MRTLYRNIKKLSGKHIGSADASANHGSSCTINTGIRTLCTTQAKLHDAITFCSTDNTGSFCSNQTLVVDDRQNSSLYQLCLHDRGNHLDQRLTRENNGAFRNRINITAETEISQIVQKILIKRVQTSQISDILLAETKIFNIINYLIQSGSDRIATVAWIFAVKSIKNYFLGILCFKIALHHRQFIQVSE